MDIAILIFRIGIGVGAVLVGLGVIIIALSLRPVARDARALASDARRLANLAERELAGRSTSEPATPSASAGPVQSPDTREDEQIA
jgi:hypothetical protein